MSKLDQIRALREARFKRTPRRIAATVENYFPESNTPKESGKKLPPSHQPLKAKHQLLPKHKGRPLDKDRHLTLAHTKPWEKVGMSRRTWFRRRQSGSPQ